MPLTSRSHHHERPPGDGSQRQEVPEPAMDPNDKKYRKSFMWWLPPSLSVWWSRPILVGAKLGDNNLSRWRSNRKCWRAICVFLLASPFLLFLRAQLPLTLPGDEPWCLPKESLGAFVLLKEESHSLIELVLHLYSQGFSHIRLTDNGSTRELPLEELRELRDQGLDVTLDSDKRNFIQKWTTFKATQRLRFSSDWMMPVDADEFPHATRMGSLLNYLALKDDEVCSIALPMFFFGSSGRDDQPNSILQGFVQRRNFAVEGEPTHGYKTVARSGCTMWMSVHHTSPIPWKALRTYNANVGLPRNGRPASDEFTEKNIPEALINHYRTQSRYFYEQVKTKRCCAASFKIRTMELFDLNNQLDNDVRDEHLAKLSRQRFPSLYGEIMDEGSSLAFQTNKPLTNPWPVANIKAALRELRKHQGLAVLDAVGDFHILNALRNAALLDVTWDCVARVPQGHASTVVGSGLTKLCAVGEAREGFEFADFVRATVKNYGSRYDAFVAMGGETRLPEDADTVRLREDAKKISSTATAEWRDWENTTAKLVPKL